MNRVNAKREQNEAKESYQDAGNGADYLNKEESDRVAANGTNDITSNNQGRRLNGRVDRKENDNEVASSENNLIETDGGDSDRVNGSEQGRDDLTLPGVDDLTLPAAAMVDALLFLSAR